jgi:hypothetical protein
LIPAATAVQTVSVHAVPAGASLSKASPRNQAVGS